MVMENEEEGSSQPEVALGGEPEKPELPNAGEAAAPADAQASAGEKRPLVSPFTLQVSDDRMRLLLSGRVDTMGIEDQLACLETELQRLTIADPVTKNAAKTRFQEIIPGQTELTEALLFEGTPPTLSRDGQILWADEFFKPGYEIDPLTGAADYRRPIAKVVVTAGQLLATISPPMEGIGGHDIFGRIVPPAKAKIARIRVGANVRLDEEENAYYANKDGRIRYMNEMLHVDDVYQVQGSVDLKTGHIKHPGAVIVAQNIEAESRVEAEGDIEVQGYVEDSEIITGGNLVVHGGITGGAHLKIRAAGRIHAKFVSNADIEAGESVYVDRELDQSNVKTRGAAVVSGRIVGGHLIALGGIEADQIGSEACVRTMLVAGEDFTLRERLAAKEEELQSRKDTAEKIAEKLAPIKDRGRNLPQKVREVVGVLLQEAARLRDAIQELEAEIEAIRAESRQAEKKEILVRRRLCPECLCQIMGLTLHVREFVDGPIKIALREGDIRLVKTTLHH